METLPSVPAGLTLPLTVNNETNHNGVITVITSFALFVVLGSLGIRIYSAYSRRVRQLDDLTFAATVVYLSVSTDLDPFEELVYWCYIDLDLCLGTDICRLCSDSLWLGEDKITDRRWGPTAAGEGMCPSPNITRLGNYVCSFFLGWI